MEKWNGPDRIIITDEGRAKFTQAIMEMAERRKYDEGKMDQKRGD